MNKIFAAIVGQASAYRAHLNKNGFTMLDALMTVTLLLGVAVGGFLAYTKIIENAVKISVESAASSIYEAALAAEMDGNSETTSALVQSIYNNSQDVIEVTITTSEIP